MEAEVYNPSSEQAEIGRLDRSLELASESV